MRRAHQARRLAQPVEQRAAGLRRLPGIEVSANMPSSRYCLSNLFAVLMPQGWIRDVAPSLIACFANGIMLDKTMTGTPASLGSNTRSHEQ